MKRRIDRRIPVTRVMVVINATLRLMTLLVEELWSASSLLVRPRLWEILGLDIVEGE